MYDIEKRNGLYYLVKRGTREIVSGSATSSLTRVWNQREALDKKVVTPSFELHATPKPIGLFANKKQLSVRGFKPGMTVRNDNGLRFMELVTSNSYRDREREFIPTTALQEYVGGSWIADDVCLPRNKLLYWHDKRIHIGDVVWVDMQGPFLIEVAKERRGTFVHKGQRYPVSIIWDFIEAYPALKWGASHGFKYMTKMVDLLTGDVTYDRIHKFETSVLPLENAANPFTYAGVMQ